MIFDDLLYEEGIAFDAVSEYMDLLAHQHAGSLGEPIMLMVTGEGLTESSGNPRIDMLTDTVSTGPGGVAMTIVMGPLAVMTGGVIFAVPTNTARFAKFALEGFDGGTWKIGVVHKVL